jgi:hypothetical protein
MSNNRLKRTIGSIDSMFANCYTHDRERARQAQEELENIYVGWDILAHHWQETALDSTDLYISQDTWL